MISLIPKFPARLGWIPDRCLGNEPLLDSFKISYIGCAVLDLKIFCDEKDLTCVVASVEEKLSTRRECERPVDLEYIFTGKKLPFLLKMDNNRIMQKLLNRHTKITRKSPCPDTKTVTPIL